MTKYINSEFESTVYLWSLFLSIEAFVLLFIKATNIKLIDEGEMVGFSPDATNAELVAGHLQR